MFSRNVENIYLENPTGQYRYEKVTFIFFTLKKINQPYKAQITGIQ